VATSRAVDTEPSDDRRAEPRIELEVEVGLETDHNFYTGLTQDISSGGLFIATSVIYHVGDRLRVRFSLPGQTEPITAEAEVRWVRDPRAMKTDSPEGIGLRFVELPAEAKTEISEFLSRRESLFYDVD
jgi:uncharacterized protein (TIGR02266 family)